MTVIFHKKINFNQLLQIVNLLTDYTKYGAILSLKYISWIIFLTIEYWIVLFLNPVIQYDIWWNWEHQKD